MRNKYTRVLFYYYTIDEDYYAEFKVIVYLYKI